MRKTLLKIFGKLFVKALNFSKFLKLLDAIRDTWKAISFHLIDYLSITNSKVKFYSTGNPTSIQKRLSVWISSLVLVKKPGVFSMTKTINHNYNLTWLTSFVFCLRLLFRLFIFTGSSVASSGSFDPVIASFTTFQISIFRIFETILNVLNRVNASKIDQFDHIEKNNWPGPFSVLNCISQTVTQLYGADFQKLKSINPECGHYFGSSGTKNTDLDHTSTLVMHIDDLNIGLRFNVGDRLDY